MPHFKTKTTYSLQRALRSFIAFFLLAIISSHSQSFGLNKVQYQKYEWKQIQTAHFDIYFYQGGEAIASWAANKVEPMYDQLQSIIGHTLSNRIPIILHNTHAQFEATNVIRMPIPEAVGGFTEVFKNRIVLPFNGSYAEFDHVLQHEMVHGILFDFFRAGGGGISLARNMSRIPLWFNEGLAEYASIGWDLESEFYLLDAVTFGYVRPPTQNFQGFLAYKGGQNFLFFLEESFGKGTVKKILLKIRLGYSLMDAFKVVTQTSLEEISEIWLRELRYVFWPELGKRQYAKSLARQLTKHHEDQSFYNLSPSISPDGSKVAFFSDRGDWEGIYILDIESEKITQTAIEGGNIGAHESFHPFSSSFNWSPDGKQLVLISKQSGRDVIHLVDANGGGVDQVIRPDFEAISSPDWSPDGKHLVFSAQKNSQSDLWLYNLKDGSLKALTHDLHNDQRPTFSPSGNLIAFESNRDFTEKHKRNKKDVYLLDLQTLSVTRISQNPWDSKQPTWGKSDSTLIFVSNRSGVDNLYLKNLNTDSLWSITNLLSGATSPSWSRDEKKLVFTLFENGGFDLFIIHNPLLKLKSDSLPTSHYIRVAKDSNLSYFRPIIKKNLSSFSADSVIVDSLPKTDSIKTDSIKVSKPKPQSPSTKKDSTEEDPWGEDELFLGHGPTEEVENQKIAQLSNEEDSLYYEYYKPDTNGTFLHDSLQYISPNGDFIVKDYEAKWSLDQAVGMAGFDNVNGLGGLGYLTFTDLMGDEEINFMFTAGGSDLDNINLMIGYDYKPYQLDIGITGYHLYRLGWESLNTQEFLLKSKSEISIFSVQNGITLSDSIPLDDFSYAQDSTWLKLELDAPYSDRYYGGNLNLTWPFSIYSRVQFNTELAYRLREYEPFNYNIRSAQSDTFHIEYPTLPTHELNTIGGTLSWSFDNTGWGIVGPIQGGRYSVALSGIPGGVLQNEVGYIRGDVDFRKYFRFFKKYTFATRMSAGGSEAQQGYRNPHAYLLGGDPMTLNWHFNQNNWNRTLDDIHFSSWDLPLRGYRYHDFKGNRKALLNLEFRYPFIREFSFEWPLPIAFRNITGVLFTDYGGAWMDSESWENSMGHGWGWGMRMNLGIFVLRYTRAWSNHSMSNYHHSDRTYWSLGADF